MFNKMKHLEKLVTQIQDFKQDETLCDVTIVVDNQKFMLHKLVLAASSDYFKALFTSNMSEKKKKEIKISILSANAFKDCISYMYHGDWMFTLDGVNDLLCAANMLLLDDMKKLCTEKIKDNTSIENCLNLYHSSVLYNNKSLETNIKEFFCKNTEKLLTNDSFIKEVPAETLEMILRSEDVCISDEACMFDALVKWTAVDPPARKPEFCKLLQFVRLPMINREHFTAFVDTNKHLTGDCPSCNPYFWKCVRHLIDGETHDLLEKQLHNRHSFADNDKAIFFLVEQETHLIQFDNGMFQTSGLSLKPPQGQDAEYRQELVTYNNECFYLVGTKNCRSFYIDMTERKKKWVELRPIPNKHYYTYGPNVASFYNKVLVIGGDIEKEGGNNVKGIPVPVSTVDCLDILSNCWITFPSLNEARCLFTCAVHGDTIYVVGGWNNGNLNSVEMYDSDEKVWKCLPSMNKRRQSPAAVFHQCKLFVSGGYKKNDELQNKSVETFREGDSAWTMISPMNVARFRHAMFTFNDELFVAGGTREDSSSVFERWKNETQKWVKSGTIHDRILGCIAYKLPVGQRKKR